MIRPATPGTLLTFVAAILLGLVTISTPIIKSIYFLEATIGGNGPQAGQSARFGALGYCLGGTCSDPALGYSFDPNQLLGIQVVGSRYTSAVIKGLTYTLILHPIALGFAVVACLLGLISHCREFSTNCFGSFVTGIGALISAVAFGLDLALFIVARQRINSIQGASASLGMAIWMTLAAWILMFLAGCAFTCGICGRRRRNRVKDSHVDEAYGSRPAKQRDDYGQQMRMEALDAEADRKRRQATLDRNTQRSDLPKFAEYETEHTVPLKNDYDEGAYANGASQHQPGLAYSTNSNIARAGAVGAGAVAGGSVINGVGQGYGRRQAQGSHAEDFSTASPMLNNTAGHGAHNVSNIRQNTMSPSQSDSTYIPGVGPQPFREDSLTPAPRPYPQVSSPPPMPDHNQYASQQQPQYDVYGNLIPSATGSSHYSQPAGRRQATNEYGHPAEYSGATFGGAGSGFVGSSAGGSRMMPSIPHDSEPREIVYGGTTGLPERRQGTVDDGFGLASSSHAHEPLHEQHTSSAQQHQTYPSAGEASGSALQRQYGSESHFDEDHSGPAPPGYESVSGGTGYAHNHYPVEKS